MKTSKRIVSLLLAGLLSLAAFVACADPDDKPKDTTADTQAGAADTSDSPRETEAESTDLLADALEAAREEADWGGKDFGILYVNDIGGYTEEVEAVEKADATLSSAVINDAVWQRNVLFEEYCNLTFVLIPTANSALKTSVAAEVQSGAQDFQLITSTTDTAASMATSNYLADYLKLEEVDYEQEWWDQSTLDFALGGHVFFMNGPFNIVDDDVTFVMMFNKRLCEDNRIASPYDTVRASEWTLDYFNSLIINLSAENGDGTWDENDTYGFTSPGSIGDTFFYGANLQYIINNRDMDGPELVLDDTKMDRALAVLDIARAIVHDNHASWVAPQGQESVALNIFMDERAVFYSEAISYLRALNTQMDTEYGVIPIPKYDVDQEHYTTWSHSIGSTLSIPTTIEKGDVRQFGNVLEVYAILSQKLVRPAYYDSMLTVRNVRDAESAEMVDMIFEHRIYDMASYFDLGFRSMFGNSVTGANAFASSYASQSGTFDRRLNRILAGMND